MRFLTLLFLTLSFSIPAFSECKPEAKIIVKFIHLKAPIGDCSNDIFFENGNKAFSVYYGDWYHSNGTQAFSNYYGDWYYDNGNKAYSKYYEDWYHANGAKAYSKYYGDWYYDNGNKMYSKYYGDWYYDNGNNAYSKYYGQLYYRNGNPATKVENPLPQDMVEFILGEDVCYGEFTIFCAVARLTTANN